MRKLLCFTLVIFTYACSSNTDEQATTCEPYKAFCKASEVYICYEDGTPAFLQKCDNGCVNGKCASASTDGGTSGTNGTGGTTASDGHDGHGHGGVDVSIDATDGDSMGGTGGPPDGSDNTDGQRTNGTDSTDGKTDSTDGTDGSSGPDGTDGNDGKDGTDDTDSQDATDVTGSLGACDNNNDLPNFSNGVLDKKKGQCANECMTGGKSNSDMEACVTTCMLAILSQACAECVATFEVCLETKCHDMCHDSFQAPDCKSCVTVTCGEPFKGCAGVDIGLSPP